MILALCSLPLIAEFAFAPFNLYSGRTMGNFERFTGFAPVVATRLFAPLKLLSAALLVCGLEVSFLGVIGAAIIALLSATYLVRLTGPGRRHADGIAAFGLTFALAAAVIALQISR